MPSMTKVKGGYKVYNKETGKSKFVKYKKQAEDMVKKGYSKSKKSYKQNKDVTADDVSFDYGGQLFKAENWVN